MSNCAKSRYGASTTAGLFLDKFIKDEFKRQMGTHLDINGPAYLEKLGYNIGLEVGAGVRMNLYYLSELAKDGKSC